jgi:hypothetical protein
MWVIVAAGDEGAMLETLGRVETLQRHAEQMGATGHELWPQSIISAFLPTWVQGESGTGWWRKLVAT